MQGHSHQIQVITDELIESILTEARRSPRRRMNYNFHADPQDNPHRFLNVLIEGTYVAPHRHTTPPKPESFVVLRGMLGVLCFADDGKITGRYVVSNEAAAPPPAFNNCPIVHGIDLPPGVWHTILALSPYVVCFEVKPGPWDPTADKEFADWAPREGQPEAEACLADWLDEA